VKLEQNYQHSADHTIEKLQECLTELKKNKLDNAGPPSPNEQLKRELGIFNPDDIPLRKVIKKAIIINKKVKLKFFNSIKVIL
jgi:hypothetical protein